MEDAGARTVTFTIDGEKFAAEYSGGAGPGALSIYVFDASGLEEPVIDAMWWRDGRAGGGYTHRNWLGRADEIAVAAVNAVRRAARIDSPAGE